MEFNKDSHSDHISQEFNEDLETLKSNLMTMGGIVERQIEDAMEALLSGDTELASRVLDLDQQTNQWEVSIDDLCARIIALRQPAASDLRMVLAVAKTANELERIGDEATRIAKHVDVLTRDGELPVGKAETRYMGVLVREMLSNSLTAFARYDGELAYKVAKKDREVDEEYASGIRALMTYMMEDPRSISRALNIIWVLRSLERIGDHSRNISQHLVYLVKGVNVSHSSMKQMKKALEK